MNNPTAKSRVAESLNPSSSEINNTSTCAPLSPSLSRHQKQKPEKNLPMDQAGSKRIKLPEIWGFFPSSYTFLSQHTKMLGSRVMQIMRKGPLKSEINQKQLYSLQENSSNWLGLRSAVSSDPEKVGTSLPLNHKLTSRCSEDNKEEIYKLRVSPGMELFTL